MENTKYIIVVQCHIVKERCSGYFCEKSFHERDGGFSVYPKDKHFRINYITCGGCCGKAVLRKLSHLTRKIYKHEKVAKDEIVVQLSSCMTQDNYHSPKCIHLNYIKELIKRAGLAHLEGTRISGKAEEKRLLGVYRR